MTDKEEIIDVIQIISSGHVGPVTFYKLLKTCGTPRAIVQKLPELKSFRLFERAKAEEIYSVCCRNGIQILLYSDPLYPAALKNIEDAPPLLYVRGNTEILSASGVAVVGARNASINGRKTAARIAYDLTQAGRCVISGMARGIDAAAHKGAMYALKQRGTTIAVLGTGADIPYPQENSELYEHIVQNGCVISEFPPGTLPQAANFPRRNRIIAALGEATVVIEANLKSGSLITARMAAAYGHQVFAVPGSPGDGRAAGPNKLIKSGARLAESADDILQYLNNPVPLPPAAEKKRQTELNFNWADDAPQTKRQKIKIIDYLNFDGVYVDEIIRASGMDASEVALELLELEMSGRIKRLPGNKAALTKLK